MSDSTLIRWFTKEIKRHEERMINYSLDFEDRKYSERAVKSYRSRLKKLNKGLI